METQVPQHIQVEHEEVHAELAKAIKAGGRTGQAARDVMKVLQPHMAREEELVAPAIALLRPLSEGTVDAATAAAFLPRVAGLRDELPRMLDEHARIVNALRELVRVAAEENQSGLARLAHVLVAHAEEEEEIFYPAALLVVDALRSLAAGS